MSVQIKVCGITSMADAESVAGLGVDVLGFNFWRNSKRFVEPEKAAKLISLARRIHPDIGCVGLFVNHSAEEIRTAVELSGVNIVQLHGDEDVAFVRSIPEPCIKAIPVSEQSDVPLAMEFECAAILVDSASPGRGGSGLVTNWALARELSNRHPRMWLAGGLTPLNVAEAIERVAPFGVDVASGVEASPGVKSIAKVQAFVDAVRHSNIPTK